MTDRPSGNNTGTHQGRTKKSAPPFAHLRPVVATAVVYGLGIVAWLAFGDALPGGRWLAVHLFTLGVLTNLIAALTHHFAKTLTRAPTDPSPVPRLIVLNVGILGVLAFTVTWQTPLALGTVVVSGAVLWLYIDLRRMRRQSTGGRFLFIVRGYERASSAFLHGAILGLLLGIGVLASDWYVAVRLAHMHTNILGWAGLVLLATVVFFGPTTMRTRMRPGADESAAHALRHGATALTVAVFALILTGAGDTLGLVMRLVAAAGLAGYALAAAVVCLPVLRAARASSGNPHGRLIAGACVWFPLLVLADAAAVAFGRWEFLDALGAGFMVGVLAQAILGALGYLTPMVWTAGPDARERARAKMARLQWPRVVVHNGAAAALTVGVALTRVLGQAFSPLVTAGLVLLGASILVHVGLGLQAMRTGRGVQAPVH